MAEYTKNFNLIKPGQEEFYNVQNFNNNTDVVDTELKNLEDAISNLNADGITLPDGKTISEKFNEITTEIGSIEELDTNTKLNIVAAINEIYQALETHKAEKATQAQDGHMSKEDKKKLDNVENGARKLANVDNVKQMPISGGTFIGIAKTYSNTSYTVAQLRNVILSPNDANVSAMNNGDIWIKYK